MPSMYLSINIYIYRCDLCCNIIYIYIIVITIWYYIIYIYRRQLVLVSYSDDDDAMSKNKDRHSVKDSQRERESNKFFFTKKKLTKINQIRKYRSSIHNHTTIIIVNNY